MSLLDQLDPVMLLSFFLPLSSLSCKLQQVVLPSSQLLFSVHRVITGGFKG